MTETVIRAVSINDRAVMAKLSKTEAESLIADFQPFLRGLAAKYSSQFERAYRDDLYSVVMVAFYESIQSYDVSKGHFFPFAKRVVRARVIDHLRMMGRHQNKTVPLDDSTSENGNRSAQSAFIEEASEQLYDADQRQQLLLEEIEQFVTELDSWGISMETLTKQSPKHKRLRETYRSVIAKVSEDADVIQTIQLKRYYPVKAISELTELPLKKIERARIFVLATLIIKFGDYEVLSEYVRF